MKKSIANLGKTLNKNAQKKINGGTVNYECLGLCYINNRFITVRPGYLCPDGSIPMC